MRLKIALLCALLVPFGTAKADVVTLSNSVASGSPTPTTTTSSLFIKFTTKGTGAFQLNTLQLEGISADNTGIAYNLQNSGGSTINSISGSDKTAVAGLVTFSNANVFGAGTYWLEITGIDSGYKQGANATLTSNTTGLIDTMTPGLVTGRNSTAAER